ncbi:BirA family transcriptional regulator, biotin operon repressor / biotin-[acetyl-CoA-carboxylase] ligase [Paenibacillus sp. CF095]|uniref:biotin--[acetyl-CoA-carboxylase] ligase n=1 Tax=unclassified Paenibacillus TaxID=185978 RepID=UPI0003E2295A|nr:MULTISPECIES: biotin--[acetyl-CoA-carboxylase] ligase [unclassified Paenibacillus]ETT53244.1 bifunctional biotin--[acetyl-CoA-carboxylase] synthetase/biotin operon repressor [Paenibacillus sp. FSL H7-689]SDC42229.1 BirA family transcriptional regulator, biotin operon repressor / biotin-[acetyl-CoA-carboxylase] ligase [Paenibacillus sp. CF095]
MTKHEDLLHMLLNAEGRFVSGEEISRNLSISRTAVWKHVNKLRDMGYEFEAVSRKGYRLVTKPDSIDATALQLALNTTVFGRKAVLLTSTLSTQGDVLKLAEKGQAEGAVVIAEEQTGGRGRFGRQWFSPPGKGIWMSVLLRPDLPLQHTPQLTLLTGVAVCRAVRACSGADAGIKWPNDLLIDGRKVCGILLESTVEDHEVRYCIAGIGVDVNFDPEDYPEDLTTIATSLKMETGQSVDRTKLTAAILTELEQLYYLYQKEGFGVISALWEALSVSMNREITVTNPHGVIEGKAIGLDPSGALIVEKHDGEHTLIISGEISWKS